MIMIKVYCYSKCSTCKKALKWLDDKGVKYELIDIKENNPSEAERPRSPQQPWPYNQQNHYDPSKLERPRSPQPQPWPYNQQRPTPPTGTASSSKPIKPVPPKPSDSGFDTPQNVRQPLSPEEIAMWEKLYGRIR